MPCAAPPGGRRPLPLLRPPKGLPQRSPPRRVKISRSCSLLFSPGRAATMMPPPPDPPPPPPPHRAAHAGAFGDRAGDVAVQDTNDEACASKLSCANAGYIVDEWARHFVKPGPMGRVKKYPPIINRGYYTRVATMRNVIECFLRECVLPGDARDGVLSRITRRQIVQIGAGFDTTYFRLRQKAAAPLTYLELDYAEVVDKKARVINAKPELAGQMMVGRRGVYPCELISEDGDIPPGRGYNPGGESPSHSYRDDGGYRLVAADLRDVNSLNDAAAKHLDPEVPTLIISECCLAYLERHEAEAVVRWCAEVTSACEASAFVLYDPINPSDAFGRQMVMNVAARGSPLRGILGSVGEQTDRMSRCGFRSAGCVDMNETWDYLTRRNSADVARVVRLEMFDEIEEWRLIQAHYCVAWGVNQLDGGDALLDAIKLK